MFNWRDQESKELKVCEFISCLLSCLLFLSFSISPRISYCNPMVCVTQHFQVYCSVRLLFPLSCAILVSSPWGLRISFSTSERGPHTLLWQIAGRMNKPHHSTKQWQAGEWAKIKRRKWFSWCEEREKKTRKQQNSDEQVNNKREGKNQSDSKRKASEQKKKREIKGVFGWLVTGAGWWNRQGALMWHLCYLWHYICETATQMSH